MSRAVLFPFLLFCCLIVVIGCGGGSSPTGGGGGGGGGFSNPSLNGTYAFLFSSGSNGGAGSFKADGAGNLVSGTMEINNEVNHFSNVPLTGTYNVSPDGRGTATLNTRFENFNLHFVIISSRHLLVSHFNVNSIDINIRGVGSIDLQDTTAFSAAALKGQFAYTLDGDIKSAGGFILDGTGAISAGIHDLYDSSIISPASGFNQPLTGSYSVPAGTNGRGTLTLNTAAGPRNFIFYIVSSGQFKIISADRPPYSAGEAFTGSNATASSPGCGPCIFFWNTLSGSAYSAAGMFTHDSAGNITGGTEDFASAASPGSGGTNPITGGTMTFAPQFRYTITLNMGSGMRTIAAYPSSKGVLLLALGSPNVMGIAMNQAASSTPPNLFFEGSYGYSSTGLAIFFGALMLNGHDVGRISTNDPNKTGSGTYTGLRDFNGVVTVNQPINGNFTMDKNGRGTIDGGLGTNIVLRSPNPQTVFFISTVPMNYGVMELQTGN